MLLIGCIGLCTFRCKLFGDSPGKSPLTSTIIIPCVHKKFNLLPPLFPILTIYSFLYCAFCYPPLGRFPNVLPGSASYVWIVITILQTRYVSIALKTCRVFSLFAPFAANPPPARGQNRQIQGVKILLIYHKDTENRHPPQGAGACIFIRDVQGKNYFFSAAAFSCSAFSIRSGVMGISVKRQPVAL